MKLNLFAVGLVLAALAPAVHAEELSEFTSSTRRLVIETRQLEDLVVRSGYDSVVKATARSLAQNSVQLDLCAGPALQPFPGGLGGIGEIDEPHDLARRCSIQLSRVLDNHSRVEHYLADSFVRYPLIFQQLQQVTQTIRQVEQELDGPIPPRPRPIPPRPVPPPYPGDLDARGALDHASFLFSARNPTQLHSMCVSFGRRHGLQHGVRVVQVNGHRISLPGGRAMSLSDACRHVVRHAN